MTSERTETFRGYAARPVDRWGLAEGTSDACDFVAEEVPVSMIYNGVAFAVMMVTPRDLDDFALGFSLTEGLIDRPSQLLRLETRTLLEGIELSMQVAADTMGARLDQQPARLLPGRSGCGICGARTLESAVRPSPTVGAGCLISHQTLEHALRQLQRQQPINAATGAVHAAAWADASGHMLLIREDVGRHNALDKLIGAMHRAGMDARHGLALVTSRASYEMVMKAASASVAVLAAISAPTALAIELAGSAGITLVGFARPGSHNIYTHPERLLAAAAAEETS